MNRRVYLFLLLTLGGACFSATAGWKLDEDSPAQRAAKANSQLSQDVQTTIEEFMAQGPMMQRYFNAAHAYAIYPKVGKAAFILGGARGYGQVIQNGEVIGTTKLSQLSVGIQIGGHKYSEVIFFKDKTALADFKAGSLKFDAKATAAAMSSGTSANLDYHDGVAVFTMAKKGLMAEAAIGGQKFEFKPVKAKPEFAAD